MDGRPYALHHPQIMAAWKLLVVLVAACSVAARLMLNGSSTPELLMRAYAVRRRNGDRMAALAARLHAESPLKNRTVIVTGATSGLGSGIAAHLALGGASLVLPHRRPMPSHHLEQHVAEQATMASRVCGTNRTLTADGVRVLGVPGFDLASFDSIERAVDALAEAGVIADALVNNAGLVPVSAARTAEGLELALGVNFAGNALWTERLRERGVLAPRARIVFVGSEEHRQHAAPLEPLGTTPGWRTMGVANAMARYGYSKLLLAIWAHELARQWGPEGVEVFDVCPGPVASEIARDLPPLLARLIAAALARLFPTPAEAALPVVALAVEPIGALPAPAEETHYHMSEAWPSPAASRRWGAWLWSETRALLERRAGPADDVSPHNLETL